MKSFAPRLGVRPLRWRGFTGHVREGIEPGPLLGLLGPDPVRTLPGDARVEHVKDKLDRGSQVFRGRVDLGGGAEEIYIKTISTRTATGIMMGRMGTRKGRRRPHHYPR
jgi:hypothetical protein